MIDFQTHPDKYRHWKLSTDGAVATLAMDVRSVPCSFGAPGSVVVAGRGGGTGVLADGPGTGVGASSVVSA